MCRPDAAVAVLFTYSTPVGNGVSTSCSVKIVEPGTPGVAHAVGSFDAEIALPSGVIKIVANGRFDVPVTPPRN